MNSSLELNYKTFGSGTPIIILHGLLGMLDNWQSFGKMLSKSHSIFLVDLRNHGSSPHAAQMSYPAMSEDLVAFMDRHWLYDDVSIIGHSMGGKVAMQTALSNPNRIRNLFVIDIAPKRYDPFHLPILAALSKIRLNTVASRREIESELMQDLGDQNMVRFLVKNIARYESRFKWKMNFAAIQRDYGILLDQIDLQGRTAYAGCATFYQGSKSDHINAGDLPLIKQYFVNADLKIVPEAGHWVHIDNPNFLAASILTRLLDSD